MRPFAKLSRLAIGLSVATIATMTTTPVPAEPDEGAAHVVVAPQPLATALQDFSEQSGLQVAYVATLAENVTSKGTEDAATPAEALTEILADTGLDYRFVNSDTVAITVAAGDREAADPGNAGTTPSAVTSAQASETTRNRQSEEAAGEARAFPLDEIIVTATKRTETIRDVPIAVSAIGAEEIRARGLTQYADYLNGVPGVYFQDAGPGQSQIRIRGVVANEAGGGTATVATYFGETVTSVLTIAGGKPDLRLVDVERVEVLRGPQGTLFGANSLAGVVRIVPKSPELSSFEAEVATRGFATDHSGDASYHVEGMLNLPLVSDRLALRLVGYRADIAGYIDNIVPARDPLDYSFLADVFTGQPPGTASTGTLVIPGNPAFIRKDINSEDTWGARAALRWRVSDRLGIDLTQVVQDTTLNSQPHVDPGAGAYAQERSMDFVAPAHNSERVNVSTFVVSYDWDAASLVSATSYTRMKSDFRDDASLFVQSSFGVPIPWEDRAGTEGAVFTQEVRLQSQGEGPVQWLAGVFYLDQQADVGQTVVDHSCPTCIPTLLLDQDFALRLADSRFVNQEQRSIFGEVSYSFSPRWTLGLGGRYLEEDVERLTAPIEGFLVGGFLPAEEPREGSSDEINPAAWLRFKATDDATFYAQAARGFRSPQTNSALAYTGSCADEAAAVGLGPLTDPDTLWNYELGAKSRLADGRVGINAAVYRQEWEGVQLPVQFLCGSGGVINGGDVSGHGVEVEMSARLGAAWQLNLAASHGRNEFDTVKPNVGFEAGDRVPGAPETNGSAGLQYDFTINPDWGGFARVDYTYVGEAQYEFGQVDPRIVTLDAYGIANLRVGLRRDSLSLELFARNATDERAVVNTVDPAQGSRQYLARPREIGVEARYRFGQSAR